ncbi:MAG: sigma-70 family RNA polymerase sigma factor [Rubrivivax sp.]|nr:sigma-70 family RNA polymerase sigma factor [Rubrivivax sp.]
MRSASDSRLLELQPLCRAIAVKLMRRLSLPANIVLDELVQAGMVGAWQAVERFDGRGTLAGFAAQRIRGAMIDFVRQEHPAGRNGPPVQFVDVDDDEQALQLRAADDPAAEVQRDQAARARLRALPARERRVVQQVLAGRQVAEVGASMGVSGSRASQLLASAVSRLESARERTPDSFDPAAVPISMGVKIPSPQRARRNRFRELLDRMPATGSVTLAPAPAASLIAEAKLAGVRCIRRTLADGRVMVIREPAPEQFEP